MACTADTQRQQSRMHDIKQELLFLLRPTLQRTCKCSEVAQASTGRSAHQSRIPIVTPLDSAHRGSQPASKCHSVADAVQQERQRAGRALQHAPRGAAPGQAQRQQREAQRAQQQRAGGHAGGADPRGIALRGWGGERGKREGWLVSRVAG